MPEHTDPASFPEATLVPKRRSRISSVWIVPIVAAVVAVGIAIQRIASEGPSITLVFKSAEGLEAGKTFIKYKDVDIGQVTSVRLSEDFTQVELTAQMSKSAAALMVEDASFWVVRPRVTLSGITGLGTLLSGNYIGFAVGKSKQKQTRFTGKEVPPVLAGGSAGRKFRLTTKDLGSLGIGSPIYFRRLPVGEVVAYALSPDGTAVDLEVFVKAPSDKYVHPDTRFWNASGLSFSLGANGVSVRTESVLALLEGGLAFDTPSFLPQLESAAENTVFTLYSDEATAFKQPEAIAAHYVLYFKESLRGLSVGAPVTLFGLPVGEVTDVGLMADADLANLRPRVLVTFYPERLDALLPEGHATDAQRAALKNTEKRHVIVQRLVDRGMRAQLRSGSLISGQMYVALDYFPDAPKATIDWNGPVSEVPVVPSTIPDIEGKITSILTKLDELPLSATVTQVNADLKALEQMLKDVSTFTNHLDADLGPELKGILTDLRSAITSGGSVIKDLNTTLIGPDAPVQQDLRDALQQITRAARAFRVLADYLERHPEALLRGKPEPNGESK